MKAVGAKSIIFTAFINDANIAMIGGGFIGNDAINLAHFERSLVSLIVDTEGKVSWKMIFFCHNQPRKGSLSLIFFQYHALRTNKFQRS